MDTSPDSMGAVNLMGNAQGTVAFSPGAISLVVSGFVNLDASPGDR